MKHIQKNLWGALLLSLFTVKSYAQLGFCGGNSGEPIFIENFGAGKGDGPITSGNTTYSFTQGPPRDGFYKVSSNTNWYGWFITKDHTPNDTNGRCLIVNANNVPEEFFTIPVSGLCENTTYEFNSWLINLFPYYHKVCGFRGNEIANPINVTFEIWDSTDSFILKSGNTGDIFGSNTPNWRQYGLVFKTKSGQTSVILKMRNNGTSGCGNDLAIDDIMFRTCGDSVKIEDTLKNRNQVDIFDQDLPYSTKLTAIPDFSVFSSHFYQWQKSKDGISWNNIENQNGNSLSIKNLDGISYYRVLVAEDAINLSNASCNLISEVFKINMKAIAKKSSITQKPITIAKKDKPRIIINQIKKDTVIPKPVQKKEQDSLISVEEPITKFEVLNPSKLSKTYKQVIIVKNGLKTVTDKVWVESAGGKYVQTGEKIIKKGDNNADTVIKETVYYKAAYGYNCVTRTYTVKKKL